MTRLIATGHIRRYLLGELSDEEEAQFEVEYFADPALLADVEAEDHDLVDDYVSGQLTTTERERFEARHCTLEHLEEIALARALRARETFSTRSRVTASFRVTPLAWAAAAALAVALFIWSRMSR